MLFNYLKVVIRNLYKNKIYILINITGMGIALAFCLTIYLVYAFNSEFDDYYKDVSDIVRVHEFKQNASGEIQRFELAPIPMGPRVLGELTGVIGQTRYIEWGGNLKYEEEFFNESVAYVDSNFFDFFPIKLASGSASSIKNKNTIFLTKERARKFFGDDPALNKTLTLHWPGKRSVELVVAGVFERIPLNSSFDFDALTSIDHFLYGNDINPVDWTPWQQVTLFLRLNKGVDKEEVQDQLPRYVTIQNNARDEWKVSEFQLVDFKDDQILNWSEISGSNANLRLGSEPLIVFYTLAMLVLLIACFNLANTSMALMATRVREIGVRKVMGGGTLQVFSQFILEVSVTSFLAILLGMAIFNWMADWFYALWNAPIQFGDFSKLNFLVAFLLLFLFTTIVSGLYPALYSRRFNPSDIFRNQVKLKGSSFTSKVLNALQFTISIILLVAGVVFSQNANFLKDLDVGYSTKNLIMVNVNDSREYNLLRDKVQNQTDILDYTGTNDHFGWSYEDTNLVLDSGNVEIRSYRVGDQYLDLVEAKLLQGRMFYKDNATDYSEAVIVNEEYLKRFNIDEPIGEMVNLVDGRRYIVGVMQDVIRDVYSDAIKVPEIYIPVNGDEYEILIVRARGENEQQAFGLLEEIWKEIIPDRPFTGRFQNDLGFGMAMKDNNNLRQIFLALAVLGGLLSLTGIFSLSSLNVTKRFKEIGIRKVMGASSRNILVQLNRAFLWTMLFASLLGIIFGYIITNGILGLIYSHHVEVGIPTLVLGSISVLLVALITTSATIISAANTNPAYILRDE